MTTSQDQITWCNMCGEVWRGRYDFYQVRIISIPTNLMTVWVDGDSEYRGRIEVERTHVCHNCHPTFKKVVENVLGLDFIEAEWRSEGMKVIIVAQGTSKKGGD